MLRCLRPHHAQGRTPGARGRGPEREYGASLLPTRRLSRQSHRLGMYLGAVDSALLAFTRLTTRPTFGRLALVQAAWRRADRRPSSRPSPSAPSSRVRSVNVASTRRHHRTRPAQGQKSKPLVAPPTFSAWVPLAGRFANMVEPLHGRRGPRKVERRTPSLTALVLGWLRPRRIRLRKTLMDAEVTGDWPQDYPCRRVDGRELAAWVSRRAIGDPSLAPNPGQLAIPSLHSEPSALANGPWNYLRTCPAQRCCRASGVMASSWRLPVQVFIPVSRGCARFARHATRFSSETPEAMTSVCCWFGHDCYSVILQETIASQMRWLLASSIPHQRSALSSAINTTRRRPEFAA